MSKPNKSISPQQEFINSLNLRYAYSPIKSRPDTASFDSSAYHFHVAISNHAGGWSGYYSMGSGHRVAKPYKPGGLLSRSDYDRLIKRREPSTLWEKDVWSLVFGPPVPALVDVLYSLVSESDALNYTRFDDWAESLGYNTDSRAAETSYRACLDIGLKLRAMFGSDGLEALRNIYQDY